ncbi:hypothetical protein AVEN_131422-1 [Araneus ventricosus]|uniref:Uncharacterized protein n=1 Tax=Araneus ventricosus TaxID=182803 RepID=A0A4Y2J8J5_ARAVE|nr:hypothetical protein AVEN_131422-1 [Araneus ventricosus]
MSSALLPSPLKMFQAHINAEYCHSVKYIRYYFKYVTKGSNMAVFGMVDENAADEVTQYHEGRYISSNETACRLFNFQINEPYPTVVHLSFHLKNSQKVCFMEENVHESAERPHNPILTARYQLCHQEPFAKTLPRCAKILHL